MVVNARQRKLWHLAIGSLRTILVEHVEPDEFSARSRFLAHVSNFPSYICFLAAAEKQSNLRFQFDGSSIAIIFRENSFDRRVCSDATSVELGLFIGNNEAFGIE